MRSGWGSSPGGHPASALDWQASDAWRTRLYRAVAAAAARPPGPDWLDMPTSVRALAGEHALAVIGYGSWYVNWLRKPSSFPDVYLIVDDYRAFHARPLHAWMNRVLPPNVYFVWSEGPGHRRIRGKYNVISAADLERECGPGLRDVYNAGRLTKLVWLAWVRDEAVRGWAETQLVRAVCTLAPIALACLPERFTDEQFSLELLGLSFRGEPRLEGWERVRALRQAHLAEYTAIHRTLLEAYAEATGLVTAVPGGGCKRPDPRWRPVERAARRVLRRSRRRGYLRWPRVVLTEPNLVDLAVDEAERKAGVRIEVTPRLRRHPFLFGLPAFLRVLRARAARERIR